MATYSPVSSISEHHAEAVVDSPPQIRRKPVPQAHYQQLATVEVSPTASTSSRKSKQASFFKSWYLELLSCLLAFAALAAIVIILKLQDGRPLPEWPKLITVNSLVSVFTAILKAAMILPVAESISELKWLWYSSPRPLMDMEYFDGASRGPLGSLDLIWRVPRALLPCLGAIITISALAIDPFTQQVIQYYNCLELFSQPANISRINDYSINDGNPNQEGFLLDSAMTAVLYQGLINPSPNATAVIPFVCATGNCTFPSHNNVAYHSLGMCHDVVDISDTIESTVQNSGYPADFGYKLPSGIEISSPARGGYIAMSLSIDVTRAKWKYTRQPPLFAFEFLTATFPDREAVPKAFRSAIFPCVNSYTGSKIENSILSETVVSSTELTTLVGGDGIFYLVGDYPATPGIDCTPTSSPSGNKTLMTYLQEGGSAYPAPRYPPRDNVTQYYDPSCVYTLAAGTAEALQSTLKGFFGTTTNSSSPSSERTVPSGLVWQGVGALIVSGVIWLKPMYNNGNGSIETVQTSLASLTNAMTVHMRRVGAGAAAIGATSTTQTCIHVEWSWLALNATLMGLTIILFLTTIWMSQRKRDFQPVMATPPAGTGTFGKKDAYKSSSLPLLWCGPDNDMRQQTPLISVRDMEQRSGSVMVQLVDKGGRLNLDYVGMKPLGSSVVSNKVQSN